MLRVTLYRALPSDTWAFSFGIPWRPNVVSLVAGFKDKARAVSAVQFLADRLGLNVSFVA